LKTFGFKLLDFFGNLSLLEFGFDFVDHLQELVARNRLASSLEISGHKYDRGEQFQISCPVSTKIGNQPIKSCSDSRILEKESGLFAQSVFLVSRENAVSARTAHNPRDCHSPEGLHKIEILLQFGSKRTVGIEAEVIITIDFVELLEKENQLLKGRFPEL